MDIQNKKTPLYDRHAALGAKLTPFAGWILPERYGAGFIEEHMAVRGRAGLFDVSHMGEIVISGPDAFANVQNLFTNDFSGMEDGQLRYTVMCDDSGGILDDMIVYRMNGDRYFVVVNASNREKDVEWMAERLSGDAEMRDISDETAQIALQGPASAAVLAKLTTGASGGGDGGGGSGSDGSDDDGSGGGSTLPGGYYRFTDNVKVAGARCLVSRSGYTGEDGFELYCAPADAGALWDALLEAGSGEGLIPCGLGARDTLRLEAAMPLYGHEMDRSVTPFETGLKFAVKLKKSDFIGKAALIEKRRPERKRIGIKITGRGIARDGCDIFRAGEPDKPIGKTTSGTFCPYLGYAAAMALVGAGVGEGEPVVTDIRGRLTEAVTTALPFYKRANM
jgi:aminomethyltransferase